MPPRPYLLYVYPWMPYPRRLIIYLREKRIPSSAVTLVPVSDRSNEAAPGYPPRPPGSLPVLAIPQDSGEDSYAHMHQSLAIIHYLEELCESGKEPGFPKSDSPSMRGATALERARNNELLVLADECTMAWNPVRMFGTGAGTMRAPAASREMLRWVRRQLNAVETWFDENGRDLSSLREGRPVTIAEIVLYQFLEFTEHCYGVDMTKGSGEMVKDVYGRDVVEKFPRLEEFYRSFGLRDSARRVAEDGEVASDATLAVMRNWSEGIL